jgi:hypothetical protein
VQHIRTQDLWLLNPDELLQYVWLYHYISVEIFKIQLGGKWGVLNTPDHITEWVSLECERFERRSLGHALVTFDTAGIPEWARTAAQTKVRSMAFEQQIEAIDRLLLEHAARRTLENLEKA